ncbi:MAG: 50S ribosomal protein L3 [Elusimicrobia bacterium]|nr:50S ribosomal protein L3 [Elusimicrobiota bacterium]
MAEEAQQTAIPRPTPKLKAILAKKIGMTQVFDDRGLAHGATELAAGPCHVAAVKTKDNDGYTALTLGFDGIDEKSAGKPLSGMFKKSGIPPVSLLKEVRLSGIEGWQPGQTVQLDGMFAPGDYIDVCGVSKGKGFAGGVKRWGFHGGPKTHGQSDRHRAPGSLAARRSLGRVMPGKKMAGHMGARNIVVQKLEVLKVDGVNNRLFIKGAVPGAPGNYVLVKETVKRRKHRIEAAPSLKASKKRKAAPAKK